MNTRFYGDTHRAPSVPTKLSTREKYHFFRIFSARKNSFSNFDATFHCNRQFPEDWFERARFVDLYTTCLNYGFINSYIRFKKSSKCTPKYPQKSTVGQRCRRGSQKGENSIGGLTRSHVRHRPVPCIMNASSVSRVPSDPLNTQDLSQGHQNTLILPKTAKK